MWRSDEILDVVAGPINAPAAWRLQFWMALSFNNFSVAMIEGDANRAAVYLWVLSREQGDEIVLKKQWPILGESGFNFQEVRALPEELLSHWSNWPFARVGETVEETSSPYRDGIWMTLRSFDGSAMSHADLTNPDKEFQPLRYHASQEVFKLLDEVFEWNKLMATSFEVVRQKH